MNDGWWLEYIFGESQAGKTNPAAAKLAAGISPQETLALLTRLFSKCGSLFAPFTDRQVAEGLVFLGASGESDWMCNVYESSIPPQLRAECIRAIEILYRECFALRCRNATQHLSSDTNSLNSVCYMWWDRFPSGGIPNAEKTAVDSELIEVMAKALYIEQTACQESALHGLGHWECASTARVHAIIDNWLTDHPGLSAPLREYAKDARNGHVQ